MEDRASTASGAGYPDRLALPRMRAGECTDQHDLPMQGLAEDGGHMLSRDDILRMAREAGFETKRDMVFVDACEITPTLARFAALIAAAEREAISDEYAARLQGDLENGVRWLNEKAASEFNKKYPQLAGFNEWLNERGNK
jgi:hypothetical protein